MSVMTDVQPVLEAGVHELLQQHRLEDDFQRVCELTRDCFPELTGIRVHIVEDPDVDGHCWIVLDIVIPGERSYESMRPQWLRYHEQVVDRGLALENPRFALHIEFARE